MKPSDPTIEIVATLSDADADALFAWDENIFPQEGRAFTWENPTHHIIARVDGNAVAHVGIGDYVVHSKDASVGVIGVGGVVVRREFQRRGIPRFLFNELATTDVLQASRKPATLFCPERLVPYYEQHAFRRYEDAVSVLQQGQYVDTRPFAFMLRGPAPLSGALQVPSAPW